MPEARRDFNTSNGTFYRPWTPQEPLTLSEVGAFGSREVTELFTFLLDRPLSSSDEFFFRPTPSLVLRGEAEIAGISDPRFGYRILLTTTRHGVVGFANLRRLGRVLDQIQTTGRIRRRPFAFGNLWSRDLRRASSIADSILKVPDRLNAEYSHVITMPSEVTLHYGETEEWRGVPFIKHLRIVGGGLCAQACCWMAEMLSYPSMTRVVSPAEITILARDETTTSLGLDGLSVKEILRFFNAEEGELRASLQTDQLLQTHQFTQANVRDAEEAVDAYISSNCPVLLPVDLDRMTGRFSCRRPGVTNIHLANGAQVRTASRCDRIPRDRRHMVVIIGINKATASVIFNDPAERPFMMAALHDLFEAGCYRYPQPTDTFRFGDVISPPTIIPVVPRNVAMPLLQEHLPDSIAWGLFEISSALIWPESFGPVAFPSEARTSKTTFRLLQLCDVPASPIVAVGLRSEVARHIASLQLAGWNRHHWVWLESKSNMILIWDAEKHPKDWDADDDTAADFLISLGALTRDGFKCVPGKAAPNSTSPTLDPVTRENRDQQTANQESQVQPPEGEASHLPGLRPALITSFSHAGLLKALRCWPSPEVVCDLYAFMRNDAPIPLSSYSLFSCSKLEWFVRHVRFNAQRFWKFIHSIPIVWDWHRLSSSRDSSKRGGFIKSIIARCPITLHPGPRPCTSACAPDLTVCEWLASRSEDPFYIRDVAARIIGSLDNSSRLALLTTFLPEITASGRSGELAVEALKFVARLAEALGEREHTRVRVIEIVAGSLIDYVECRDDKQSMPGDVERSGRLFVAKKLSKSQALERLVGALKVVVPHLPDHVSIAIELEPGPLFALSEWTDLVTLHDLLASEPALDTRVGFNLDVAHWALAPITADSVEGDEKGPISRIIHSHVSDFGRGHFGDLPPTRVNSERFFRRWFGTIRKAYSLDTNRARATGLVSLELELPESLDEVQKATQWLVDQGEMNGEL